MDLLLQPEMQENIKRINTRHLAFKAKMEIHPRVKTARVQGVIFALEINRDSEEYYGNFRNKLYNFFIENGVIMRPVGNIIYILPPYIIQDDLLEKIYQIIEQAIEKVL